MRPSIVVACVSIFAIASAVSADKLHVKPDGTGDVTTIQAAVDSVAPGDTVLLASGTYTGTGNYNIGVPAKDFLLTSESGDPADCIIDCEGHLGSGRRGIYFQTTWATGPAVRGITIRNGNVPTAGEGVLSNGTFSMRDCVLEPNVSGYWGGAIAIEVASGQMTMKNCAFSSNEATVYGGAIVIDGVEVHATIGRAHSMVIRRTRGGAICCYHHSRGDEFVVTVVITLRIPQVHAHQETDLVESSL